MTTLKSKKYGSVHLLAKNARIIRDADFTRLVESVRDDQNYLAMRGIIIWQVPKVLSVASDQKSPFTGQEGKIVVLGGNQRYKALVALGKTELEDRFVIEAKDADGNWISPEEAERIVVKDNSPEGISGEFDYKMLFENYSIKSMQVSGIDFSHFKDMMQPKEDPKAAATDEAEKGEFGEKDESLKTFIEHREQTRKDLKEIDEAGFHLLLVFDSPEEKFEFISKAGLTGEDKVVSVNGDIYVDLVFESYKQKLEFCEKAGISEEPPDEGSVRLVWQQFVDGRAFAKKFGIELAETGLHFRDRRVDSQLSDLAREEDPQKTEEEQQEAQFAEAKKAAAEASPDGRDALDQPSDPDAANTAP